MATVKEHIEGIWTNLGDHDRDIQILLGRVAALEAQLGGLDAEIDLDLPHASADSAALRGAAGREATVDSDVSDDTITVSFPAASPERQEARRRFAEEVMNLNADFPGLEGSEEGLSAVECYARGGPQWLYLGSKEGRDHILTLPPEWKRAMIEDVALDSTLAAQEMGRDILKDSEPSAGMGVTYDYLLDSVES